MKKTALISVFSKEGIVEFAKELIEMDWDIIASGGTAKVLIEANIPVKDVAELVGGQAILGHRVVTLSREIHAGLLAQDIKKDKEELLKLNIPWIDMVCNDLYPLQEEINNSESTKESVIEKTDIGGPTLLRSAAKGRRIVISDAIDRKLVIKWLKKGEPNKEKFIDYLVSKAEIIVAKYCLSSANYHSKGNKDGLIGEKVLNSNYGENPWQTPAALFTVNTGDKLALDKFKVITGIEPSFNNLCDIDRLLQTITHIAGGFDISRNKVPYIAVGVKHGNACGAAIGDNKEEVLEKMINGDKRAIFGGWVMINFELDKAAADTLITYSMPEGQKRLLDGIIAPSFDKKVVDFIERKTGKCRLMINPNIENLDRNSLDFVYRFRYVRGGFLRQPNYTFILNMNDLDLEKHTKASQEQEDNLLLAWAIGSTSNSNTITLVKDNYLISNGTGQQDRVGACKLAINIKAKDAGHNTNGAVAYSDSFFPFTDGPEVLIESGIKAILTSSGSVKDKEVIDFCKKRGIVLYMIPDKKARGFFGH